MLERCLEVKFNFIVEQSLKGENMKKKETVKVDIRSKHSAYITIGKWVIYVDNSTGEYIIDSWKE